MVFLDLPQVVCMIGLIMRILSCNNKFISPLIVRYSVNFLHHYKKCLVPVAIGVTVFAIGLKMFKHTKKEERHRCWW
jgi:hypothetical protein